jgi:hypothetical protein
MNMLAGTFVCSRALDDATVYTASIERLVAEGWFHNGEVRGASNVKLASIRAYLDIDGRSLERTFNVEILQALASPRGNLLRVSGKC